MLHVDLCCYRMNHNNIWSIDDNAFRGVGPEMEIVDMSHNRLVRIKLAVVFRYLSRLRVLRLRYNSLVDVVSPIATDNDVLPGVHELDLTGNEFDHVPSRALSSLPALRRLILRDNRIQHVGESAFSSSAFLELVDLGANRFSRRGDRGPLTIDRRAFCGLEPHALSRSPGVTDWTGLQQVRLDHNGLTQPELCSLMGVWTLVDIDLSGNPLRCDCHLLGALRRLTDTAVGLRVYHATQCASPARLAGHSVDEALRLLHWQSTCADDDRSNACDETSCTTSLSHSTSSSIPSTAGSPVTPCTCAVALAFVLVRIVAWSQTKPQRIRTCISRTVRWTTVRN